MKRYTKTKVIRITETQLITLKKMKSYNVDVGNFIRQAISEKIQRQYSDLIPKKEDYKSNLIKSLEKAILQQQCNNQTF